MSVSLHISGGGLGDPWSSIGAPWGCRGVAAARSAAVSPRGDHRHRNNHRHLGCPWGPLGVLQYLERSLDILVSWGALWRSHGSLGTTLAVILMVFMSKPGSAHNFDGFDVQITKKKNYSKPSHLRLPSFLHISLASVMCTSPLRA